MKFPRKPNKWTEQNMFDHICKCLSIQKQRSMELDGSSCGGDCLYRGPNGRRCAIGHCIKNSEYRVDMELSSPVEIAEVVPSLSWMSGKFMDYLQKCHDESTTSTKLKSRLRDVAKRFELKSECVKLIKKWK